MKVLLVYENYGKMPDHQKKNIVPKCYNLKFFKGLLVSASLVLVISAHQKMLWRVHTLKFLMDKHTTETLISALNLAFTILRREFSFWYFFNEFFNSSHLEHSGSAGVAAAVTMVILIGVTGSADAAAAVTLDEVILIGVTAIDCSAFASGAPSSAK